MTKSATAADIKKTTVSLLDHWVEAIAIVATHYQMDCAKESLRLAAYWSDDNQAIEASARQAGLELQFLSTENIFLSKWRLPLIIQLSDGLVGTVETLTENNEVGIRWITDNGLISQYTWDEVANNIVKIAVAKPLRGLKDSRVDSYIKPFETHWIRNLILQDIKPYFHVVMASLMFNILGLAGVLFSMQVYDRVIPAQSMPTLYVLFGGVFLASIFAFILKILRGSVMDIMGKRADMRISDRVFGHAIRVRMSAKPASTGSFISQLREIEQVREMVTSSTVGALMDMPFFLIFLLFFSIIAGPLVWVPLVALFVMLAPSLMMQKRLAQYAQMNMRESSLRNALLVESVQGLEDIKSLQAEMHINQQWNRYNHATADSAMQQRNLTNWLTSWSQTVQTSVFALVIMFGVPMVIAGDLTTGSLVAASILSSRMLAPMAQITQVLTRWQQAKVAMQSLNAIVKLPVDGPADKKPIHKAVLTGDYAVQDAVFCYTADSGNVLNIKKLQIKAGERVAILGRNGAGKSTLLQTLAGHTELVSGKLLLDGLSLHHIESSDLRRDIGLLTQQSRLFYGTLRENLTLGAPRATDAQIVEALELSGAMSFVKNLAKGLDHLLMEGGVGLSGGQRQALLLARLLLRKPNILLLDEPTAAFDDNSENAFINGLENWLGNKTLIIATHRMAVLKLVQRIIVVEGGQIVLDAPKDQALATLGRVKV